MPALQPREPPDLRRAGLAEWLAYGESLHAHAIDLGLDRVQAVRRALGLEPGFAIITVAGTNGKGSTCAMLGSMLRAGGYRVGVYTSPHLVRFNERVCVDGMPASDADLCAAFARVDAARGTVPLTLFEFGTLAAMCVFERAGLDAAVLEVGLGGRLDAVNIFDADVGIVTSIGIDHVEYLGSTREAIGREKAGIFRHGRPAVSADADPPATLAEEAQRTGARLLQAGRDYRVDRDEAGWSVTLASTDGTVSRLGPWARPALVGSMQVDNAAACAVALHVLSSRLPLSAAHCRAGLERVSLPGRFQRMRGDTLGAEGVELLFDVAHNPHAAERLAATLAAHPVKGRCLAVFSMLRDKDIIGTARALADRVDAWFIGGIDERRGACVDEVAAALATAFLVGGPAGKPVRRCRDPLHAFKHAVAESRRGDRVLVSGSFATVGAVLAYIERVGETQNDLALAG